MALKAWPEGLGRWTWASEKLAANCTDSRALPCDIGGVPSSFVLILLAKKIKYSTFRGEKSQ